MKVLVTGGTGFLGRHVVWRLMQEGFTVQLTGRNEESAKIILKENCGRATFHKIDHGTSDSQRKLSELAEGANGIIHCAALSAPWGSLKEFHRANVTSTREVLTACSESPSTRLVYISSPAVYCEFCDRLGIREDDPLPTPMTHYAATKGEAEELLHSSSTSEVVILRPRAIFGPWDTVLLPRLLRVAATGVTPLVRGGGALLDLTYVDNVVDAIMLALQTPLKRRVSTYNVSNGEPIRFDTLLNLISEQFGVTFRTRKIPYWVLRTAASCLEIGSKFTRREPIVTSYGAAVVSFSQTLSIEKICRELGYVPRVTIAEGLKRHAAHWHRCPQVL